MLPQSLFLSECLCHWVLLSRPAPFNRTVAISNGADVCKLWKLEIALTIRFSPNLRTILPRDTFHANSIPGDTSAIYEALFEILTGQAAVMLTKLSWLLLSHSQSLLYSSADKESVKQSWCCGPVDSALTKCLPVLVIILSTMSLFGILSFCIRATSFLSFLFDIWFSL